MGIPIYRPPSPPAADPVLSPASHRIRRRPRERSSQTLLDLLRNPHPGGTSERERLTSQIWRELNSAPRREAVFLPLPIPARLGRPHPPPPPPPPQHTTASTTASNSGTTGVENERPRTENERPPPPDARRPPPPPPPPPLHPYAIDGLGDRERSLSPEAQSHTAWAALLPDDIGFATACDLWDDEEGELLGVGFGLGAGAGGIEEALMEFRRRREEQREEEEALASQRVREVRERLMAINAARGRS